MRRGRKAFTGACVAVALSTTLVASAEPGVISTYSGGAGTDGLPATSANLDHPQGVTIDNAGNLYIADAGSARIRKVDRAGIISTVAGTGTPGFSGDGGPATGAQLDDPVDVAVDSLGNLYISDSSNARIRRVDPAGRITTMAGTGTPGYSDGGSWFSGDGGPATEARFLWAAGIAVDANDNLYVADTGNARVRRVGSDGVITTVAGDGSRDSSGDGGLATSAAVIPNDIAFDSIGNMLIADTGHGRVRKVDAAGVITTVAGNDAVIAPVGISVDAQDNLYFAERFRGTRKVDPAGTITTAASVYSADVEADASGNVYIAEYGGHRVFKLDASGDVTPFAGNGYTGGRGFWGDGGLAVGALHNDPSGVATELSGNLYIADTKNNRVRKVAPSGEITTVAGNGSPGYAGDGGAATAAMLNQPQGVATDLHGNLYIADTYNERIRKVDSSGVITTIAGGGRGLIFCVPTCGDGGPATSATLKEPKGVAVDLFGNVIIADTYNLLVRWVDATNGKIWTAAGGGVLGFLGPPTGVAVDALGNIYIADPSAHRIWVVVGGVRGITMNTVAGTGSPGFSGDGGSATSARLNHPSGVAVDPNGNLYIADTDNQRIRKVTLAGVRGIISTVAGSGDQAFFGDGGSATVASLNNPTGVAADRRGGLYIADRDNQRIRKIQGG